MQAAATLRNFLDAAGLNLHVCKDDEGWPIVPGTYGRLEGYWAESDGSERVFAFSARPNVIRRLKDVPGLHQNQIGDAEARFWLPADDHATLQVVAQLIRAYRRRPGASPETLARARAAVADGLIKATAGAQVEGVVA
jgi:hypothetical protein